MRGPFRFDHSHRRLGPSSYARNHADQAYQRARYPLCHRSFHRRSNARRSRSHADRKPHLDEASPIHSNAPNGPQCRFFDPTYNPLFDREVHKIGLCDPSIRSLYRSGPPRRRNLCLFRSRHRVFCGVTQPHHRTLPTFHSHRPGCPSCTLPHCFLHTGGSVRKCSHSPNWAHRHNPNHLTRNVATVPFLGKDRTMACTPRTLDAVLGTGLALSHRRARWKFDGRSV